MTTPPSDDAAIPPVSLEDLTLTWRTLRATADAYFWGSPGHAGFVEACRLVEVEVRARYGDEAWQRMTTTDY